jgi:hypothetical protein
MKTPKANDREGVQYEHVRYISTGLPHIGETSSVTESQYRWQKCHGHEGNKWQRRWEEVEEIDEQLRGSRAGAGSQVSMSFPDSSIGDVIVGGSIDNWLGLGP